MNVRAAAWLPLFVSAALLSGCRQAQSGATGTTLGGVLGAMTARPAAARRALSLDDDAALPETLVVGRGSGDKTAVGGTATFMEHERAPKLGLTEADGSAASATPPPPPAEAAAASGATPLPSGEEAVLAAYDEAHGDAAMTMSAADAVPFEVVVGDLRPEVRRVESEPTAAGRAAVAGRVVRVAERLMGSHGRVSVQTSPQAAAAALNGAPLSGQSNLAFWTRPGQHQLTLRKAGFADAVVSVTVVAGRQATIVVTLQPAEPK